MNTAAISRRQRLEDAGLAVAYAAVFIGYTVLTLGRGLLELPLVSGQGPGIPGILPTIELLSIASIAFVGICAIALAWRRSSPELSFLIIAGVGVVQIAIGEPISLWNIAMPISLFSVAAYGTRRFALMALLITVLGYVGIWAIQADLLSRLGNLPNPVDILLSPKGAAFVVLFAALVVIWAIGDQVRAARERLERDLERAQDRAREQEAVARNGALAERQRIARELHDVVAHGLSVMIVQADGALYAEAEHPEAPREALATIASTGRESLEEMRHLLGVLREDHSDQDLAPQPELSSLPALIDRFRASGLDINFDEIGTATPLEPAVGLTAYRVIQESLTNVLHHAGPTHVEVQVDHHQTSLALSVTNEPGAAAPPRQADTRPGLGLLGMRERVGLLHGKMTAGPVSDGRFRVRVEIPTPNDGRQPATGKGHEAATGHA